jgi:hypothetical protein
VGGGGKDDELDELDTLPAAAMARFKSNTEQSAEQLVSLSPLRGLRLPALALRALSIALRMPPSQAGRFPASHGSALHLKATACHVVNLPRSMARWHMAVRASRRSSTARTCQTASRVAADRSPPALGGRWHFPIRAWRAIRRTDPYTRDIRQPLRLSMGESISSVSSLIISAHGHGS